MQSKGEGKRCYEKEWRRREMHRSVSKGVALGGSAMD